MQLLLTGILCLHLMVLNAFTVSPNKRPSLQIFSYASNRSSSSRSSKESRSKRQERVGQLVKTELARIIQSGNIKGGAAQLNADTRQRISLVSVDVSPDLRQARISVSIRSSPNKQDNESYSPAMEQRRAYSWLVGNTKELRHTLAQRMSHMKNCPMLTFVQVDVGAAVDVMFLIDKVTQGYKRTDLNIFDGVDFDDEDDDDDDGPTGLVDGVDFDEELDDDEWIDEDDEDFV
jgi:ribosome-binding factor A